MAKKESKKKSKTIVAREVDGTIQITFSIAWKKIEKKRETTAANLAKNIQVDGFRKGKAPVEQAMKKISHEELAEKTLSTILPELFSEIIVKEKLRPAIYPKFELVSANEGEDWQVRARTCELPIVDVKNYKSHVSKLKFTKKQSKEEREAKIMDVLIAKYDVAIPEILITEEVNSRLSSLLQRLEKLGLELESYLASVGKNPKGLREEYSEQARKAILLDLILQQISIDENIKIKQDEVTNYLQVASNGKKNADGFGKQQENTVRLFLTKRKTLDMLVKLV